MLKKYTAAAILLGLTSGAFAADTKTPEMLWLWGNSNQHVYAIVYSTDTPLTVPGFKGDMAELVPVSSSALAGMADKKFLDPQFVYTIVSTGSAVNVRADGFYASVDKIGTNVILAALPIKWDWPDNDGLRYSVVYAGRLPFNPAPEQFSECAVPLGAVKKIYKSLPKSADPYYKKKNDVFACYQEGNAKDAVFISYFNRLEEDDKVRASGLYRYYPASDRLEPVVPAVPFGDNYPPQYEGLFSVANGGAREYFFYNVFYEDAVVCGYIGLSSGKYRQDCSGFY